MRTPPVLTAILLAALGCSHGSPGDPGADAAAPDAAADAAGPDGEPADFSRVYAHSGQVLYRLDTATLTPVEIGPFANTGAQSITDIAIDKDDRMLGITLDRIYTIDVATGEATFLRRLASGTPNLTSLSFVPVDLDDPDGEELLVAAADDGTVYRIDPATGDATTIGSYGTTTAGRIRSSGDLVAVRGLGIFATVTIGDDLTAPDHLAVLDPVTWAATPLGVGTGHDRIFGIGFWRDTIYGFVDRGAGQGGAILALDPATGAATVVDSGTLRWYGAGVTTDAPVVD